MKTVPRASLKKPNLLIIGASGGVANAFLHHFLAYRNLVKSLYLMDRNASVLENTYLDLEHLNFTFTHKEIKFPDDIEFLTGYIHKHKIDIIIDLTDEESIPFLEVANTAGVSLLNTGINDNVLSIAESVNQLYVGRAQYKKSAHLVCSGMNPGCVNMWVRYAVEKFGVPKEMIEFEFDSSMMINREAPMISWSKSQFLGEAAFEPGGLTLGRYEFKSLLPNSLTHRTSIKPTLKPVLNIPEYPEGFLMFHEECTSIANKWDIPTRFIYAVHPVTMKMLVAHDKKHLKARRKDLIKGDNTSEILQGADNIGVCLDYSDKKVYYFNSISNSSSIGHNATYDQVVVGLFSGLLTLMSGTLKPGLYFPEDIYNSPFKHYMFDNMRVSEYVFKKKIGGVKLQSYTPRVRMPANDKHHYYFM